MHMVAHKMDKKNLVRQPVESLFNWINQKTELQNASKVRALNALMVHIFGALATALFYYIF